MTGGRPLRFLALALGGWILVRVALLLPEVVVLPPSRMLPELIKILVPDVAAAIHGPPPPSPPAELVSGIAVVPAVRIVIDASEYAVMPWQATEPIVVGARRATKALSTEDRTLEAIPSPRAPPARVRDARRLNGSAWLLVRGGPAGTVSGGQLGASQGGMRLTYALGHRRRFALAARIATPLKGAGREAAVGIEWQPTRLPIRLVAEQRFVLDGGRGGPTLGVIAGYGPSDIAPCVRLEAYGQAGAIGRDRIEGFVDASARVTYSIGKVGGASVDIGIGAWGSAQRDAGRFDVGPSIVATLPVARKTIRLALDWRERIVGGARPGSGPALSIGSDF